jgi:DNA-binding transcriptional ArsR family regulator
VAPLPEVRVVDEPDAAAVLAQPVRRQVLQQLVEPGSASSAARALGLPRQLVAYHVRELERHGFVRLVREEQRRGCIERIVQSTARQFTPSPAIFGGAGLAARRVKDRLSGAYLAAMAAQTAVEVGAAQAAAHRAGRTMPSFTLRVDVRLASPAQRHAFAQELGDAVARLVAKYHDTQAPDGREHRVFVGAYPTGRLPPETRQAHEEKLQ